MSKRERYTPVSQLPNAAEDPHAKITWDVTLPPHLDQERIVVDNFHLGAIQKIGGFSTNRVFAYQGDTTQYHTEFSGINPDGTAQAAFSTSATRAPRSEGSIEDPFAGTIMDAHYRTTSINRLNRPEIADRVVNRKNRPTNKLGDEKLWADELSGALAESIGESSRAHHLRNTRPWEFTLTSIGSSIVYGPPIASFASSQGAAEIALATGYSILWYATWIGTSEVAKKVMTGSSHIKDRRWSLIPSTALQPDRLLATKAIASTLPIIKARK